MNMAADMSVCLECGRSHAPDVRRATIRRGVLSGVPSHDLRPEWPCWYPPGEAGQRLFQRDAAAVRDAATPDERNATREALWEQARVAQGELDEIRRRHRMQDKRRQ